MGPRHVRLSCIALLAACGSGGHVTGGPDGTRQTTPPILTPLPDMPFTVPAGGAVRLDFEVSGPRYVFATVDWQDPANNLTAVFTGRGCHSVNDALGGRCLDMEVHATASTCPAKPRGLNASFYVPVALRLWVANTGATPESGNVRLTHCNEPPDCGATGSCMECSVEAGRRSSCTP
jgi:hypothetical protein